MTEQEEGFVHFTACMEWLNHAWRLIDDIKKAPDGPLKVAAFQFALVVYCHSYTESRGQVKNHHLNKSYIPPDLLDLHKRIMRLRHKMLAHSDLTLWDAKLYVKEFNGHRYATIVKNVLDGAEELPNIDKIQTLIERTLDSMYTKSKDLEAALPTK